MNQRRNERGEREEEREQERLRGATGLTHSVPQPTGFYLNKCSFSKTSHFKTTLFDLRFIFYFFSKHEHASSYLLLNF